MPATRVKLYAWADPAFFQGAPVDHTWVTDFDIQVHVYPDIRAVVAAKKNCWLCWGGYRSAASWRGGSGPIGTQNGSLPLAVCLVAPNADSGLFPPAQGTIFNYGVDGVCHQLANQVLYATGTGSSAPLTVAGARGYVASAFIYGTYGLQKAAWAAKIASCTAKGKPTVTSAGSPPKGPPMPTPPPDDFEVHARTVLSGDPDLLSRLLALRGEVRSLAAHPMQAAAPPSAEFLNMRNQYMLEEAAKVLGPAKFEEVFGFPAGQTINLVDPTVKSGSP